MVRHDGGTEGKDGEEERLVRNAVLLDPSEASREASEFCFANTTVSAVALGVSIEHRLRSYSCCVCR